MLTRGGVSRAWNAAIAVVVVAALAVQCVIAVKAPGLPRAHAVGTLAGAPVGTRLIRVISFFTIQSNILAAVSSARLAMRGRVGTHAEDAVDGFWWRVVRLNALVGITVTGIVYATVLARVHEPKGWEQVSTNAVFHYVAPIAIVLGWLAFGPRRQISRSVVAAALAWPVLWFAYTLAHGAVSRWYPYPFVDVAGHGYGRVIVNALLVTAVLAAAMGAFAWGDRRLPLRRRPR